MSSPSWLLGTAAAAGRTPALAILVFAALMGTADVCRAEPKKPTQEQTDKAAICDQQYIT